MMGPMPIVSELDALRLEHHLAQFEIAQLRGQLHQQHLKQQMDQLAHSGFILHRQPDGRWVYSPVAQEAVA